MNQVRRGSALVLALALSGCTIARPLIDRDMSNAPIAACAAVNGDHPLLMRPRPGAAADTVEAGAPPQCFVLAEELEDGRRHKWSGGPLRPGRTLIAIHQPGELDCKGRFTHLTLTGASAGAGQVELSTWDVAARPAHKRAMGWNRPFGARTFTLGSIDNPTMAPAGARIRVLEGSLDPASLCFKSY
jgi:hypothetical protein